MNMTTHTLPLVRSSLVVALAMACWSPLQSRSAEPTQEEMTMDDKMMDHCREMKDQKQRMQADIQAQNAELRQQVATMNNAAADQKVPLIAALLSTMVEQRIAMDARGAKMERDMMQHMMQHAEMGKDSVSGCPMMKGMADMGGRNPPAPQQPGN